jgi:transcriptional regulator with XRE-family HTH domain
MFYSGGVAHKRSSPSTNLNLLGARLASARQEKGWTQDHLAIQLQLAGWRTSRIVVSQIETGRRSILDFELVLIAGILGVSVDQLIREAQVPLSKVAAQVPDRNKRWPSDE